MKKNFFDSWIINFILLKQRRRFVCSNVRLIVWSSYTFVTCACVRSTNYLFTRVIIIFDDIRNSRNLENFRLDVNTNLVRWPNVEKKIKTWYIHIIPRRLITRKKHDERTLLNSRLLLRIYHMVRAREKKMFWKKGVQKRNT